MLMEFAIGDLKPENFLFSNKSKEAEIKLIDFGLAIIFRVNGLEVIFNFFIFCSYILNIIKIIFKYILKHF